MDEALGAGQEDKVLGAGVDEEYDVPQGQAALRTSFWEPALMKRMRRWGAASKRRTMRRDQR